jgi:hypothetical protein
VPPPDPAYPPPSDPYQGGYPPAFPDPAAFPGQAGFPGQPAFPDPSTPGYLPPEAQPGYPGFAQQWGQPGYPAYPPPPPPRRGGAASVIVVVVALLVVVVGGGIAAALWLPGHTRSSAIDTGPSGAASPASSVAGSALPSTGAQADDDLTKKLVDRPEDSQVCTQPAGTNEHLTLDQAAGLSSDVPGRKAELASYNYVQGAVRCWTTGDVLVTVRLYQFAADSDAAGFFNEDINSTSRLYTPGNISAVPGVPAAKTFATPKKDDQGYVSAVSIGVNGTVVLVATASQEPPLQVSVPNGVLAAQYQRL